MFYDRIDAGERLADALMEYKGRRNAIVIAIPRGGAVIGYTVAKRLRLPLDVIMIKKLPHPIHREYAIGAVSLMGYITEDKIDVPPAYIKNEVENIQRLLENKYVMYYGNKKPVDLSGKTVIIVDDGIATGYTFMTAITIIQQQGPIETIAAVPVGRPDIIEELGRYVNKIVCLESDEFLTAVSNYYKNFDQVSDKEVQLILNRATR